MTITRKIKNKKPPSWVSTKKEKNHYYGWGRLSVLLLETLDIKNNKTSVRYLPRIAGCTFTYKKDEYFDTPEKALDCGKKIQSEMRKEYEGMK